MKRWLLRILLCLILGAITTVAVAWGFAYCGTWDIPMLRGEGGLESHAEDRPTHHVLISRWSYLGSETVWIARGLGESGGESSVELNEILPAWCYDRAIARRDEPMGEFHRYWSFIEARGWPAVALACEQRGASDPLKKVPEFSIDGGIETARSTSNISAGRYVQPNRILPCNPVWPGFVIDTLFYAAIWFGVVVGFASAKRLLRAKRGRCPRCGYDLRGGVMSDKRLAMSGEAESANCKPQASGLRTSLGCPECGWGRAEESSPKG